jgi:hypothetical protein
MEQLGRRYLRPAVVGRLGQLHDARQQRICKGVLAISVVEHASTCRQSEVLRGVKSRDERNPPPGCRHLRMLVISGQRELLATRRLGICSTVCNGYKGFATMFADEQVLREVPEPKEPGMRH